MTPVVALISRETGEVRAKAIPNVTGFNLFQAMRGEADPARTILHTDKGGHYTAIGVGFARHETVDHGAKEYVRGDVSTNQAEKRLLKRSIDGTHHHVSVDHLPRYLAEFSFRHTYRKESDTERMTRLVGRVGGRRMTYREPGLAWS